MIYRDIGNSYIIDNNMMQTEVILCNLLAAMLKAMFVTELDALKRWIKKVQY